MPSVAAPYSSSVEQHSYKAYLGAVLPAVEQWGSQQQRGKEGK